VEEGDPECDSEDAGHTVDIHFTPDGRDEDEREPQALRLIRRRDRWAKINAESMVTTGLAPDWIRGAPVTNVEVENIKYVGAKHLLMLGEIQKELDSGIIREVTMDKVSMLLRVFLIPKKQGEWRKILDCTPVNVFCKDKRFKMEDHRVLAQLLRVGMWSVSIDIKAAYHHVYVQPELQGYLCFRYGQKVYQYIGMPFGIKMAPRVFTKLMHRCIVVIRHHWAVEAIQYIDDIWIGHMDREYLVRSVPEIAQFLRGLGWLLNVEKSELEPKQRFEFLGWTWDSVKMTVCLSVGKARMLRNEVKRWIKYAKKGVTVRVRILASLIGKLSATRLQFKMASLYLAELNRVKSAAVKMNSWEGRVRMNESVLKDLQWWKSRLRENKPRSLATSEVQADMWTDASPSGWGAHVILKDMDRTERMACGFWYNDWSSNKRELVAVKMALQHFRQLDEFSMVHHFLLYSDNTVTVYNLNRWASARSLV
jgi:hypothetical protein